MKKFQNTILFLLLTLLGIVGLHAEENNAEGDTEILPPINSHYSTSSIGYSMGGTRAGVYFRETWSFLGSERFGFGLGLHGGVYANPQVQFDLNGISSQDSWRLNFEIGPGWHIGFKNRYNRVVLYQQIGYLLVIEGYFVNTELNQRNLIHILETGVVARQALNFYFTEHFAFTVGFGLGVIFEVLAELENGEQVDTGTYTYKKYPNLYLDADVGISFRI